MSRAQSANLARGSRLCHWDARARNASLTNSPTNYTCQQSVSVSRSITSPAGCGRRHTRCADSGLSGCGASFSNLDAYGAATFFSILSILVSLPSKAWACGTPRPSVKFLTYVKWISSHRGAVWSYSSQVWTTLDVGGRAARAD